MKALFVAMSVLAISSPVFAQGAPRVNADRGVNSAPSDTRPSGSTNAQGERLVCRTGSASSTSRMAARRVCRTTAEWREISRNSGD